MNWSENKSCIIGGILVSVLVIGLLFPTIGEGIECGPRPAAKNDEQQIVSAVRSFDAEYGLYPKMPAECVPTDRKFLAILMGIDPQQNRRKIVFLEIQDAKKKDGRWRSGLQPETGVWLDPYGNPYLVKIDTDYDGFIPNPYTDSKAGQHPIPAGVIVWSSGKDGIFGNPKAPGQLAGSDDIISWQ